MLCMLPDVHLLDDPWAPHPVVNRHVCSGGGGGGDAGLGPMPNLPDYSKYITAMTDIGNKGQQWAGDLYDWAKSSGKSIMDLVAGIGQKAGAAADTQQATGDRILSQWEQEYGPESTLVKAQRADAERMITNLPQTEEQYAGRYGADAAMAIDQQKKSAMRAAADRGFAPSAISTGALDSAAGVQRAAATVAASETGRYAARDESRNVTKMALDTGTQFPGVATTQQGLATGNRNQQANVNMAGASTAAGLYSPASTMYGAAFPYMSQWGQYTGKNFDQSMAQRQQQLQEKKFASESDDGGIMGALMPIAGGIAGSFLGPMGTAAGSAVGKMAGGALGKALFDKGGKVPGRRVPRYANGGAIDTGVPGTGNFVDPEMSPSNGEQTDDVNAMLNAGEFVMPERTVDWYGEKFFQNLIMKADKEQEKETVAEPEEGPMPPQAIQAQAPMFRSEGARV